MKIEVTSEDGTANYECNKALLVLFAEEKEGEITIRFQMPEGMNETHQILAMQGLANGLRSSDSAYAKLVGESVGRVIDKSFEVLESYAGELQAAGAP